jgi:hypothetical protein
MPQPLPNISWLNTSSGNSVTGMTFPCAGAYTVSGSQAGSSFFPNSCPKNPMMSPFKSQKIINYTHYTDYHIHMQVDF